MLKVYDSAITFSEFPDEIAICLNITNCPGMCSHCSEPWLREDIGTLLTEDVIQEYIDKNPHCTVFGIMGGDRDHQDVIRIAKYVHAHSNMKVGVYSGLDYIDLDLVPYVDLYKIGRWIQPQGDVETWHQTNNGVLQFPWSNQLYFIKEGNKLINATQMFRTQPLSDLKRYII